MNDLESVLLQLAHDINAGDETAQAEAERILNGISDTRLVPALVPLLGDYRPAAGIRLCDLATILLRRLGQSELVEAFNHTLEGSTEELTTLQTCALRGQVIEALMRALESNCSLLITSIQLRMDEDAYDREHKQSTYLRPSLEPSLHSVIAAAEALSELSAAEVLPRLRSQLGLLHSFGDAEFLARQAIAEAVARLEARETLPRPAESASSSIETLPRAIEASERATDTLPRIILSEANNP